MMVTLRYRERSIEGGVAIRRVGVEFQSERRGAADGIWVGPQKQGAWGATAFLDFRNSEGRLIGFEKSCG
jgi:hypothetical protein